jgi:MSHA type pilus biogenesis protein MshL
MCSNMNKLNNIILYRIWHNIRGMLLLFLIIGFMTGCAASKQSLSNTPQSEPQTGQGIEDTDANSQAEVQVEKPSVPYSAPAPSRPSVNWQPSFTVEDIQVRESKLGLPELKVGANIESQSGKVVLRDIIRGLANLKGFNVSWNKDANQNAPVDVDIKADDDFWVALDNVLRQLDYFFEFKNDTLIIGYKQTKTYQVSMPSVSYTFTTSIGGNMLGGSTSSDNLGEVSLATVSDDSGKDWAEEKNHRYVNRYDLWKTFRQNLDQILEIWEMEGVERETLLSAHEATTTYESESERKEKPEGKTQYTNKTTSRTTPTAKAKRWVSLGKGSYTIDESLGIITVDASPLLQKRIVNYIDTFKSWLYRQVSIQANILEVELSEGSSRGIDWSQVFKAVERGTALISGNIEYGDQDTVYEVNYTDLGTTTREGMRLLGKVSLAPTDFRLFVNALEEQGTVNTISEPRLNLLNGSPGVLTVGESVRYIREITKNVTTGTSTTETYTVETDDILSGLAFSVVCNVLGDDEVVLYLTPVTSQLKKPLEYRTFGANNEFEVGLPEVKLRQMSTMAKIRDGDLLILGGLIDEINTNNSSEIPLLGKIPWVKWAFKNEIKSKTRRELIIILRPHILPI